MALVQIRPIFLGSLLIVVTPYAILWVTHTKQPYIPIYKTALYTHIQNSPRAKELYIYIIHKTARWNRGMRYCQCAGRNSQKSAYLRMYYTKWQVCWLLRISDSSDTVSAQPDHRNKLVCAARKKDYTMQKSFTEYTKEPDDMWWWERAATSSPQQSHGWRIEYSLCWYVVCAIHDCCSPQQSHGLRIQHVHKPYTMHKKSTQYRVYTIEMKASCVLMCPRN